MILEKVETCKFFSDIRYISACGWELGLDKSPAYFQIRWQRPETNTCTGIIALPEENRADALEILEQLTLIFRRLPAGASSDLIESLLPQEQISGDLIKQVWADFVCQDICN